MGDKEILAKILQRKLQNSLFCQRINSEPATLTTPLHKGTSKAPDPSPTHVLEENFQMLDLWKVFL